MTVNDGIIDVMRDRDRYKATLEEIRDRAVSDRRCTNCGLHDGHDSRFTCGIAAAALAATVPEAKP